MRLAHISDLHLRHHLAGTASIEERLSRLMPDYFAAALADIEVHSPDILVITGDLLDYPLGHVDDPEVQDQGRKDLQLIDSLLSSLPFPVLLTFGNHDHPQLFYEVFGHYPNDLELDSYWLRVFHDDQGPYYIPQRIGCQRTRFLESVQTDSHQHQIHIQHYIVWPPRNEGYPYSYGESAWMRDQLISSGHIKLVLSGHLHTGVPLFQDSGVWFATIGAFCEVPHPYAIYDIEAGNVRSHGYSLRK